MAESNNLGPTSSHPIDISGATSFRKKASRPEQLFNETDLEIIELKRRYVKLNDTIDAIVKDISQYIIGQDKAVKILSFIVYNNLYLNMLEDTCGIVVDHLNGLVIGPSGTGKSKTLELLAKKFKIPFTHYHAEDLTSAGYVGDDVSNILDVHLKNCGGDLEVAQRGIIFLDEIDKKASAAANNTSGRDINGTQVQQELLKLLEPNIIPVGKDKKMFDTHMLTVIMGGKFEGLPEIREQRLLGKRVPGFEDRAKPKIDRYYDEDDQIAKFFDEITSSDYIPDDLIKFGFIDEFVGRILLYAEYKPLTVDIVEDIIYAKDSFLQQYLNVFYSRGVDLIVDPLVLNGLATSVANSKIGARDIRRKIIMLLLPALYDTEQNYCPGICEIDHDLKYTSIFQQRESDELEVKNIVMDFANRTDLKPSS